MGKYQNKAIKLLNICQDIQIEYCINKKFFNKIIRYKNKNAKKYNNIYIIIFHH